MKNYSGKDLTLIFSDYSDLIETAKKVLLPRFGKQALPKVFLQKLTLINPCIPAKENYTYEDCLKYETDSDEVWEMWCHLKDVFVCTGVSQNVEFKAQLMEIEEKLKTFFKKMDVQVVEKFKVTKKLDIEV